MRRLLLVVAAACALTACGSSERPAASRAPQLPRALAQRLAAETAAVAAALARGDDCGAGALAARLRTDANASIARVPAALQEPLSSGVNAVVTAVPPCPPAAAPAQTESRPAKPHRHGKPEKKHDDHGKHDKHDKHEKHGDEDGN
jgi:hypothetical protein